MAVMLLRILVIATAAVAMFVNLAMAVNYDAGEPNGGWDLNTSLQAWANNITFMEGDTITFVYGSPSHSVMEVAKTDYDGCLTNASISSDNSGRTVISLNSIGSRYFICGTATHCDRGMKVVITTVAAPPPPPTTTPSVPPPAATPSSSPTPAKTPSPSTVSPATSPVASPAPKTASPANSPKISPSKSPVRNPSKSPASPPPSPPPAAESPANPPSPSAPPPSSANKINVLSGVTAGVGFAIMMLLMTH